jgi:microcystin-dependent protein
MSQPYVGEIRMFAGNFAPAGWNFCDGTLVPISQNETLFNLIGTTYGGDGQSTFALPDLRGRLPLHMGNLTGTNFSLASTGGVETVTLTTQTIPAHGHPFVAAGATGNAASPQGAYAANSTIVLPYLVATGASPMTAVTNTGGSNPHNNLQPFLCISFIISLFGVFPSQT